MKTNYFALHQGKIVYVPEVPKTCEKGKPECSDEGTDYNAPPFCECYDALRSAIASGIEVENQDEISQKLFANHKHKINASYGEWVSQAEGKLYPLQCRVEIKKRVERLTDEQFHALENQNRDNPIVGFKKKVARVTFEQPEKEPLRQCSYCAGISQVMVGDGGWKICPDCKGTGIEPEAAGQEQEINRMHFWKAIMQYRAFAGEGPRPTIDDLREWFDKQYPINPYSHEPTT